MNDPDGPTTGMRSLQPPPRIMMIDDEASNLQIVKIILMRESFQCDLLLYDNGREALDYLRGHAVDLILLDLAMPGIDGFEVMTRLKENPATAEIPVIFLSAHQDTEYILRAFELGATDFIGKPIISPILTARIRYIIDTRRLQNELRHSNDELVNTNRLKDELLSICSHDLRSPLNSIELICQFLTDAVSGRSDRPAPELINRIVSQSRLARRLVENLLDLNRIEEGRLAPTLSFFPLVELVRSCVDDELPTLQARELRHELKLPDEELLGFGDREMISQVVHNVLNNASKFAQSTIRVRGELADFTAERGGRLMLSVADDGRGIAPEEQRGIFEKYAKLEAQGGGSGLGLYISRQMLELHHGSIVVRSGPDHGTEFEIALPNVFSPEQLPDLGALHNRRIVVAATSRPTAQLLESVLVEAGMIEVQQITSPGQMDATLAGAPPELMVLDVQSELLAGQLAERLPPGTPASGWILHGQPGDAERIGQRLRGEIELLDAPLNPLIYLRAVARLLGRKGTAGASATV